MIRNLVAAITAAFTLVLASSAPPTLALAHEAGRGQKGVETADLDRKVDPCTDFYEFANGAWRAENPIPASMPRWSRRIAARESNKQRVQSILEEVSQKKDWLSGSIEQLLGDHYASCMDEAGINAKGLTPLAPLLAEIDGARSLADVPRSIRRLHELGVAAPFGTIGAMDYHEPKNFIENVVAGGLGLPDRSDYLDAGPPSVEGRAKYLARVARVLALGGMSETRAREAAGDAFAVEKRLAEASLASAVAADPAATDHKMSFAQLKQLAPHFDWDNYFDEAKLPRVDLNVAEPRFIEALDKELQETPLAAWKAYLQWRLLDSFNLDQYLGKAAEAKPRGERCAESTEALFGQALGKKYAERYFPPAAKAKVLEMARNLQGVLQDEVSRVQWLTPETKKKALAKLAISKVMAGYPDSWTDYSKVIVRRDSFWANVAAGRRFNVSDDRRQIGKPTNQDLWLLPASSPDAYIDLQLYKLVLPAGFLQPPYFNLEATDAVNYGALGINLAHDLTHAIDALGAETDLDGQPENWWTQADRREFETRGQCVVDQFEEYFIEPGVHHNGKRVMGEAIGDLTGVRVAWLALGKSTASHLKPVIDGPTLEQQFFISWGQTAGAAMRLEAQRALVAGDPHPVPKFRVIGPLSNSPEFAQAFSCRAGAPMVRPEGKRCKVW